MERLQGAFETPRRRERGAGKAPRMAVAHTMIYSRRVLVYPVQRTPHALTCRSWASVTRFVAGRPSVTFVRRSVVVGGTSMAERHSTKSRTAAEVAAASLTQRTKARGTYDMDHVTRITHADKEAAELVSRVTSLCPQVGIVKERGIGRSSTSTHCSAKWKEIPFPSRTMFERRNGHMSGVNQWHQYGGMRTPHCD